MKKRVFFAGLAALVVFGGLIGFDIFRDKMIATVFANFVQPPVTVSTAEATVETWPRRFAATGSLTAIQSVDVAPQVGGTITEIAFESGQRVKKGDPLIHIDDAVERADLARLEASEKLAQITYERAVKLNERQFSSQAAVDQAKATLDQVRADIAKTKALIDHKLVRAPFTGVLGVREANLGQYVAPGTKIVGLEALDRLYANLTIAEQRLHDVKVGQTISFAVDTFENRRFTGQITAIDPRLDQMNRTILIQATVNNTDQLLRPGMFVGADIVGDAQAQFVTVPKSAVDYSLYGDSIYVVVPGESGPDGKPILKAERRSVEIGPENAERVAILHGLNGDEEVVTAGQIKLHSGAVVVVNNSMPLAKPADPGALK